MQKLTVAIGQIVTERKVPAWGGGGEGSLGLLAVFAKFRKASSCLSDRPYDRMEQHGFHWTDFHKI